jgi:hypothetical protein
VLAILAKLPPTWRALVGKWHLRDLDSYVGVNQKEWGQVMQMRFHKRQMGILKTDNLAGRLRRHRLAPDMPVVET